MARRPKPAAVSKRAGKTKREGAPKSLLDIDALVAARLAEADGGATAPAARLKDLVCAASIIADGKRSEWLSEGLRGCVENLTHLIRSRAREGQINPSRPVLRRRLKKIANAARLLEREMADSAMLALLLRNDCVIVNEDETKAGLRDIVARTETALEDLPKTQGRAKNQGRRGALKPTDFCAIIVTKAWKMARGQDAKVNGEKEKEACERVWAAAGGDICRQGGGSVAMWRDHMRVARAHLDSDAVKSILRPLTKASIHKPNEKRQATWYLGE